eukprot:gene14874-biopygen4081
MPQWFMSQSVSVARKEISSYQDSVAKVRCEHPESGDTVFRLFLCFLTSSIRRGLVKGFCDVFLPHSPPLPFVTSNGRKLIWKTRTIADTLVEDDIDAFVLEYVETLQQRTLDVPQLPKGFIGAPRTYAHGVVVLCHSLGHPAGLGGEKPKGTSMT